MATFTFLLHLAVVARPHTQEPVAKTHAGDATDWLQYVLGHLVDEIFNQAYSPVDKDTTLGRCAHGFGAMPCNSHADAPAVRSFLDPLHRCLAPAPSFRIVRSVLQDEPPKSVTEKIVKPPKTLAERITDIDRRVHVANWKFKKFQQMSIGQKIAKIDGSVIDAIEELPWWWKYIWKLPFFRRGKADEPILLGDTAHIMRTNVEQIYGEYPSVDGAPCASISVPGVTDVLVGLSDGMMYLGLYNLYKKFGGVYKLCFGPKSFMVVSDPVIMKHILMKRSVYDKGVLADILDPIMGKGLIPADPATSKKRRKAVVPGFHKKFLQRMVTLFTEQTSKATKVLDEAAAAGRSVDMEERFGSIALDIIGRAVFGYEFNSTIDESPVVKATISTLKEAEHRSMTPLPYWKIPFAMDVVPRQIEFKKNMAMLNDRLNTCIQAALANRKEEDVEALQNRDYESMENPSLLQFMVDMRDEDVTSKELRDDLMTMLIAGHETTASTLTWALFELAQQPALLARLQAEVDQTLPDTSAIPTFEKLRDLKLTRLCIAESLRMYPEPPLLIRRAIKEDTLPAGAGENEVKLLRGMDLFLAIYNMHRSELYWDNPDTFDPERFLRKKKSTVKGWAGFDPDKWANNWYPTETAADWAYLPFGGGTRKCVGDQFAMIEATVVLASILRRYEFDFAPPTATPDQVGTATGATIHTLNGLWMTLKRRK